MMKDVRKALGTFWRLQFLQSVIFEDFHQKHGFPGPLETILRQFTAQLRKSKAAQLRVCEPLRFLLSACCAGGCRDIAGMRHCLLRASYIFRFVRFYRLFVEVACQSICRRTAFQILFPQELRAKRIDCRFVRACLELLRHRN